jgi:hypothetical protein
VLRFTPPPRKLALSPTWCSFTPIAKYSKWYYYWYFGHLVSMKQYSCEGFGNLVNLNRKRDQQFPSVEAKLSSMYERSRVGT